MKSKVHSHVYKKDWSVGPVGQTWCEMLAKMSWENDASIGIKGWAGGWWWRAKRNQYVGRSSVVLSSWRKCQKPGDSEVGETEQVPGKSPFLLTVMGIGICPPQKKNHPGIFVVRSTEALTSFEVRRLLGWSFTTISSNGFEGKITWQKRKSELAVKSNLLSEIMQSIKHFQISDALTHLKIFIYNPLPWLLKLTLSWAVWVFFPIEFLCGVFPLGSPRPGWRRQKTVNIPNLILTKLTRLTTSVSANNESLPPNIWNKNEISQQ